MSFKARLLSGFILLSVLFALIFAFVYIKVKEVSKGAELIYRHPLAVSNAVRDIKLGVVAIDELHHHPQSESLDRCSLFDSLNSQVLRDFEIIGARFLGDAEDLKVAFSAYDNWSSSLSAEFSSGKRLPDSTCLLLKVEKRVVLAQMDSLLQFATQKADAFYNEVIEDRNTTFRFLLLFSLAYVAASLCILYYMLRGIVSPVRVFVAQLNLIFEQEQPGLLQSNKLTEIELFNITIDELSKSYQQVNESNEELTILNEQLMDMVEVRMRDYLIAETKFEQLVEQAEMGVALLGASGDIEYCNPYLCNMLGMALGDLVGMSYKELTYHEDLEYTMDQYGLLVSGELSSLVYQKRYNSAKNGPVWCKVALSKLGAADSELHIIASVVNISKSKQYELHMEELNQKLDQRVKQRTLDLRKSNKELQQKNTELQQALKNLEKVHVNLVQSEKMASLGLLAAGVAHEINNPINYVFNNAALLQANVEYLNGLEVDGSELAVSQFVQEFKHRCGGMKEAIGDIMIGANKAAHIVKSLRSFSQQEHCGFMPLNLNSCIENTLGLMRVRLKGIDVKMEFAELPEIYGEQSELNSVFLNILLNAIDGIEQKRLQRPNSLAEIVVRTQAIDNEVIVSIRNSGTEISDDILPKVFDPFFTTKEIGKGTGLGLSTALGIVNVHQGRIDVQNIRAYGICVTVYLPIAIENA